MCLQQYAWLARAAAVAGAWMAPAVSLHVLSGDGMGSVEVRVERMVANAVPRGGLDTLNGWLSSVRRAGGSVGGGRGGEGGEGEGG